MIYLDMDGVLADFMTYINNLGIPNNSQWFEPKDKWTEETWKGEEIKAQAMHSHGFWFHIPSTPDALELWNAVPEHQRAVLTAKPHKDSPDLVSWEKYAWINKNLGFLPLDRFVCCERVQKVLYAEGNIIVDDDHRTCDTWREHGGKAIHYAWKEDKDSKGRKVGYSNSSWPDINEILKELRNAAA